MKLLKKEALPEFFSKLTKKYEIIAPVKVKSIHRYEIVDSFDQIDLDFINTAYPAKTFFLPNYEKLFSYKNNKIKAPLTDTKRIIFGIRPCDVNALLTMDRIFVEDYVDPYYQKRRENTILIVLNCLKTGDDCFCGSFKTNELKEGFDLLLTETDQGYVIKTGSETGINLVKNLPNTSLDPKPNLEFKKSGNPKDIINLKNNFENEIWEKEAKNCLSCGACTITCPTCGCFFVEDVPELDSNCGERCRHWASCQLKNFTKVAGNHVFREARASRLKHRIYHQLVYYREKFNKQMCVGCGRCTTNCPTGIDMCKIIENLR